MEVKDKVIVVTGGANGIGAAMCRRFKQEGARGVAVVDLDAQVAIVSTSHPTQVSSVGLQQSVSCVKAGHSWHEFTSSSGPR